MADEISTTGKWVDSDGRVVESEPVEGRLLVAPGTSITPDIRAAIERAEAEAPAAPADDSTDKSESTDRADEDDNTETTSQADASETAAKTGRTGTARKR